MIFDLIKFEDFIVKITIKTSSIVMLGLFVNEHGKSKKSNFFRINNELPFVFPTRG